MEIFFTSPISCKGSQGASQGLEDPHGDLGRLSGTVGGCMNLGGLWGLWVSFRLPWRAHGGLGGLFGAAKDQTFATMAVLGISGDAGAAGGCRRQWGATGCHGEPRGATKGCVELLEAAKVHKGPQGPTRECKDPCGYVGGCGGSRGELWAVGVTDF